MKLLKIESDLFAGNAPVTCNDPDPCGQPSSNLNLQIFGFLGFYFDPWKHSKNTFKSIILPIVLQNLK